jgi:hypothetical protein
VAPTLSCSSLGISPYRKIAKSPDRKIVTSIRASGSTNGSTSPARAKRVLRAQACMKKPIKTRAFRCKKLKTSNSDQISSNVVEKTRFATHFEPGEACFALFVATILGCFGSVALSWGGAWSFLNQQRGSIVPAAHARLAANPRAQKCAILNSVVRLSGCSAVLPLRHSQAPHALITASRSSTSTISLPVMSAGFEPCAPQLLITSSRSSTSIVPLPPSGATSAGQAGRHLA